ncbi:caspase-8 isoform X1 [Erpetoichthys calabaricus]|uniref:Caspase-8 n=2 Tax=Erpetoichthys calabaricus TaxID=27687 RepID=A0A8C4S3K7_ERPCA|nr:caspase-8 isoform X1 [Erpetoichthys calabaricus]
MMDLRVLHEVDEDLGSDEISALKFLCLDVIPKKKLESIEDGKDLFLRLKDKGFDDNLFVVELLYTIQRFDLLKHFNVTREQVSNQLLIPGNAKISAFRKMLYELAEEMTTDEVKRFYFLLSDCFSKQKMGEQPTMLNMLAEMETKELLGEDNLTCLEETCKRINETLVKKVKKYKVGGQGSPTVGTYPFDVGRGSYLSSPTITSAVPMMGSQQSTQNGQPLQSQQWSSMRVASNTEQDIYRMESRPRGFCVIINNKDFSQARKDPSKTLKDRKGSDVDAEYLSKVFKKLYFDVIQLNDLTAKQISDTMAKFGTRTNHGGKDCFVCCILSHGLKGAIEATDGQQVAIQEITSYFTSRKCPSLAGKPKVFFIQACQGQKFQMSIPIQADGPTSEEEEEQEEEKEEAAQQPESDMEIDASTVPMDVIPDDSDFLLGMATVEDYLSYRSVSRGSFYIQALCKNLELGCERNEDILSILTRVNREVSRETLLNGRQMPEPRYTLTKKLLFPVA